MGIDLPASILLDGAMGSALRERGVDIADHTTSIWSAEALLAAPEVVGELHRDYIRAGADVITTNTYAVTPSSLARKDMDDRLEELLVLACRLADDARRAEGSDTRIAGSLPPLQTSYRSDLVGTYDEMLPVYQRLASAIAPYVDLFICETMTKSIEAAAAGRAALDAGKPVWVSFALEDSTTNLRGGETVQEAVTAMGDAPIDAYLVNCSSGRAAENGIKALAKVQEKPFGAYINPFWREPPEGDYSTDNPDYLGPERYAQVAKDWVASGASIIGGCCGTGPEHIAELRRCFARPNAESEKG